MNKFNRVNKYPFMLLLLLGGILCSVDSVQAQFAPRTSNLRSSQSASKSSQTSGNQSSGSGNQSSGGSGSSQGSSGSSQGSSFSGSGSSSGSSSSGGTQSTGIKTFDPFLDNHLKAPPDGITVGKFGRTIKQVEDELRLMGAKNYSYAFGKYSKMILSSYLITLSFDVNKRLGMVEVVPKPPLKTIEIKAQDFFIKLFTEGADMSQVGILLSSNKLELKFISPDDDIKYKQIEQQSEESVETESKEVAEK